MPTNKKKILKSAERHVAKKQWDKAIAEYEKLSQDDYGETSLYNSIGELYLNKGDIPKAVENFLVAAEYYETREFMPKAIALYRKILRLDSSRTEVYSKLAQLYSDQGLIRDAIEQIQILARHYENKMNLDKALESYRQIAALDPSNLEVRIKIGEMYDRQAMPDKAASEYIKVGEGYFRKGEIQKAFTYYKKAFNLDPTETSSLKGIVSIYMHSGRNDLVIDTLQKILRLFPDDIEALFTLGKTYIQEGRTEAALTAFLKILKLQPQNEDVQEIVGRLLLSIGKYEKGYKYLNSILQKYMENEQYEKALKILQQMREAEPSDKRVRRKIALVFQRLGMLERAEEESLAVIDEYRKEGNVGEAFKLSERLYRANPEIQAYRKNYFELARELGKKPVFIEPEPVSKAPQKTPSHEIEKKVEMEKTDEEMELPDYDETFGVEFQGLKRPEAERRKKGFAPVLTRKQKNMIDELRNEADVFIKYNLIDNAINRFQEILKIDFTDPGAHQGLKNIYKSKDDIESFVKHAEFLAKQWIKENEPELAAQTLNEILQVKPDHELANELMTQLSKNKNTEDILKSVPENEMFDESIFPSELHADEIRVDAPVGIQTDVDVNQVVDEFRKGIDRKVSAEDYETRYDLGIAYLEMGLIDEAISEFKLSAKSPDIFLESVINLARCYIEKNEEDEAVQLLTQAIEQVHNDKDKVMGLNYELALIYKQTGRLKDALRTFQKIKSQDQHFRDVENEIKDLK